MLLMKSYIRHISDMLKIPAAESVEKYVTNFHRQLPKYVLRIESVSSMMILTNRDKPLLAHKHMMEFFMKDVLAMHLDLLEEASKIETVQSYIISIVKKINELNPHLYVQKPHFFSYYVNQPSPSLKYDQSQEIDEEFLLDYHLQRLEQKQRSFPQKFTPDTTMFDQTYTRRKEQNRKRTSDAMEFEHDCDVSNDNNPARALHQLPARPTSLYNIDKLSRMEERIVPEYRGLSPTLRFM